MTDTERLTALLLAARWRFAWTMRRYAPHWYTLRSTWADREQFAWAVETINRLGERRPFGSPKKQRTFIYFDMTDSDGRPWCYWSCSSELSLARPVLVADDPQAEQGINKAVVRPAALNPRQRTHTAARLPFGDGHDEGGG